MTKIHSKGDKAIFFSEVSNHLLVDLGELGGELLVVEGVALVVEDLRHGDNQQQHLLGPHQATGHFPDLATYF